MDVISNVCEEIKHKNNEYESIKLTTQTDNQTVKWNQATVTATMHKNKKKQKK